MYVDGVLYIKGKCIANTLYRIHACCKHSLNVTFELLPKKSFCIYMVSISLIPIHSILFIQNYNEMTIRNPTI